MENPFVTRPASQRPRLLTVLCILTFINSGFWIFCNFFMMFLPESVLPMLEERYIELVGEEQTEILMRGLDLNLRMASSLFWLYILNLVGGIMMFRLKRLGFHLYTAAQILILFMVPTFAGFRLAVFHQMIFDILLAMVFIGLYASNLKYMNR